MNNEIYSNPLCERYSSKEMMYNFSPDKNFQLGENFGLHLQNLKKN